MKTLLLKCIDVIDHGHCTTSRWSSADERAVLSLYVLNEDGTPVAGELLELRPHDEKRASTESELTADLQAFGVSFAKLAPDGSAERVHPMDVMLRSPSPAPEPLPTLYPLDHMDGAIADPHPPAFPGFQAALRQDLADVMGIPVPDTTVVQSDAPPIDNEHVAEGCEQFADPTPTHEAVSSLDTPAQILGAGAEHAGSD